LAAKKKTASKTKKTGTKKTGAKKPAARKPAAPKKAAAAPAKSVSVTLYTPHRIRRVKVPTDVLPEGQVKFINHRLEVNEETFPGYAQGLLDHLWERDYRTEPEEIEPEKPTL